jgi:hypothetical protein
LLFVFFLPFHFHPAAASVQLAKECSCLHGTRSEAGLAPAPVDWSPVPASQTVASESFDWLVYGQFQNHGIRAPPSQPRFGS